MTIDTQIKRDVRIIPPCGPAPAGGNRHHNRMDPSYSSGPRGRTRLTKLWTSDLDGRRAAGGRSSKQDAGRDRLERDGAAGIGQMPRAEDCRRMRISAELARRARRTVPGRFQFAEEIVMLEGRRDQENGVNHYTGVG